MLQIESAIMGVKQASGGCAAGAALSTCQSSLFSSGTAGSSNTSGTAAMNGTSSGSSQSSSRVLVSLMAGTSTDDVTTSASALKGMNVRYLVRNKLLIKKRYSGFFLVFV